MEIQVNTDHNIKGGEDLVALVERVVGGTLERFNDRLTRVEVYLSDSNSHKGGVDDIKCSIEARAEGLRPFAVTQRAATISQAVDNAAERLRETLTSKLGRLQDRRPKTGKEV
jgi:ribosome-associated translation inhibitor RaiA